MNARLVSFVAGGEGLWRVVRMTTVAGDPLARAARVDVVNAAAAARAGTTWVLRGVTSNERYVTRAERSRLVARQESVGRISATCAALIPVRKSDAWWQLTQDERRRIFEEQSHHVGIGVDYLPAVARRLHHCRDLGAPEPFDFLTWFEFAPQDEATFDRLVARLRATEEWRHVEREVDIRLVRHDG